MRKSILTLSLIMILTLSLALGGCGLLSAPETAAPTPELPAELPAELVEAAEAMDTNFRFTTVDIDGNPVNESVYAGAELVMINMWEPWCRPCVGEMPDLQKLYEEYKDKGFVILGVYSTEDGAKEIVEEMGISYPILRSCDEFMQFATQYVPTTVFLDGSGNLLSEEPVVGARSHDEWEAMISGYLAG